jgi:Ca2+:H+ antiporter
MRLNWMLVFIPVAIVLDWFHAGPVLVFLTSALGIVPLAGLMGDATETLSEYMGPTWGGLLNASLGNAPEIIISIFALRQGLVSIVKHSITGSIVGNLLLGFGLAMFAGGLKHGTQTFNQRVARINGALLTVAAFGLIVPAVFNFSSPTTTRTISLEIAGVLFAIYLANIVNTIVSHKPATGKVAAEVATGEKPEPALMEGGWSKNNAIGVLVAVTIALAFMSEILTGAIEPASQRLGLTPAFSGIFLLALVGNAAEMFNAIRFARANKMDLTLGTTVGASSQVALLVAPVLVFSGVAMGRNMDLSFSQFEVLAIVLSVYMTRNLIYDGESTWIEGLFLIAVYLMLSFGFFYLPGNLAAGP